jgi:hypothetical protein
MPLESHQIADIFEMLIIGGTFVLLAYSPLPRLLAQAFSHRIMHGKTPREGGELPLGRVDDLSGEVSALRRALEETQERLDFTERMLAQQRERGMLGTGQS